MRKCLKIFLRSLGTYLGVGGGVTQPLVIVGFPQMVILITYGMKYFTMEAVSLASILARDGSSSTMWLAVGNMAKSDGAQTLKWENKHFLRNVLNSSVFIPG